jgi:hypothetical protein
MRNTISIYGITPFFFLVKRWLSAVGPSLRMREKKSAAASPMPPGFSKSLTANTSEMLPGDALLPCGRARG